jgi:hypothetical protein
MDALFQINSAVKLRTIHLEPILLTMDETGKRSVYVSFFTHHDMIQYEDRLQSFKNWSKQLMPDKYAMAEAGFLYTGQSDIVQCFGCNVWVSVLEKTDNAWR